MDNKELDEAEVRLEWRRLVREMGIPGALVVLMQLIRGAEILADIITEEQYAQIKAKGKKEEME